MADARTGRPYRRARAKLKASTDTCVLCGRWIDRTIPYPDPMSFSSHHHGVPYAHGGGLDTLRPTHLVCNQRQGDALTPVVDRHSAAWY